MSLERFALPKCHDYDEIFVCHSPGCDFRTSGIIDNKLNPDRRYCPKCTSVLIWCQFCGQYISTIATTVSCVRCGNEAPPEHVNLNPKRK